MDQLGRKKLLETAAVADRLREFKTAGMCFSRCIEAVKSRLSNSEKECIWNCAQRWEEAHHFINMRAGDLVQNTDRSDRRPGADRL
ncbi:hypothetical protein BESB_007850 [Besnoitia besnoiti]|uniref:Mitochondrial import inner membrane translocase subunit n=1 Tax=Besnoitia besnoiti TaxID=94643 RepID=A0A2A9MQD3_BESBE|nr:hypothetical protein BESB_007850 [Besnoitia besnoiti]PFH38443.1 hypothetical protein BESB_007850 [Besnoitia besnoiti]